MEEGSSVSEHMLKMSGHANKLQSLGIVIPNALGIYRVLQSLPPSYKNFVMNYNMQNMNKQLPDVTPSESTLCKFQRFPPNPHKNDSKVPTRHFRAGRKRSNNITQQSSMGPTEQIYITATP